LLSWTDLRIFFLGDGFSLVLVFGFKVYLILALAFGFFLGLTIFLANSSDENEEDDSESDWVGFTTLFFLDFLCDGSFSSSSEDLLLKLWF